MRPIRYQFWALILLLAVVPGRFLCAQSLFLPGETSDGSGRVTIPQPAPMPSLAVPLVLPRMPVELALETYQRRARQQSASLAAFSDTTVVDVELPDSSQRGSYELKRHYAAPRTLVFTPVRFIGDAFVKSNVIVRLLQSEADHVGKQESEQTAITSANYKFSYKSAEEINGRTVYVFQIKPHHKRANLIKGRIFIDACTGSLRRVEGSPVKSPSWFIKKVDFVQDYEDVDGVTFPIHLHSIAKARIIGRTIVDVVHRDYNPVIAGPAIHAFSTSLHTGNQ
jgi:hypothetical protein